jgi:hypothetical protein
MHMLAYIAKIQRLLISQYGFAPRADAPGIPACVPDGDYPMLIEGKHDQVQIKDGYIHCCNFSHNG